jgi:hypothetical protein
VCRALPAPLTRPHSRSLAPWPQAPSDDNLRGSGGGYPNYDWLGDSPLTNHAGLFAALGAAGWDVDTLSEPLTAFDAREYGALLLVDPEVRYCL